MIYLTNLRKLAEAATPGPFYLDHVDVRIAGEDAGGLYASTRARSDAKYIAALSPPVVLALLDVIEAAKAMRYCPVNKVGTYDHAFDAALAKLEQEQGR